MPMGQQPLIGIEQAATRLGITVRHMRDIHRRREIPFVRVGRLIKYKPEDLEKWIEGNRQEAS